MISMLTDRRQRTRSSFQPSHTPAIHRADTPARTRRCRPDTPAVSRPSPVIAPGTARIRPLVRVSNASSAELMRARYASSSGSWIVRWKRSRCAADGSGRKRSAT